MPDQVAQLMKGTANWNAWRRDNQCSVARPASTIAAIVAAQQPNACVEIVARRLVLSARDNSRNVLISLERPKCRSAERYRAQMRQVGHPRWCVRQAGNRAAYHRRWTAQRFARGFNAKIVQEYRPALVSRVGPGRRDADARRLTLILNTRTAPANSNPCWLLIARFLHWVRNHSRGNR